METDGKTSGTGNKTNLPVEFTFHNHPVRTFSIGDEIWTVANDACAALDLKNPNQVLTRLDDDEKGVQKVDTLGGAQDMAVVNLSGLVRLITRSNKPEARAFQHWLFHDVVPSIYKTGRYEAAPRPANPANPEVQRLKAVIKKHDRLHLQLLCNLIETTGTLWETFRIEQSVFCELREGLATANLDTTIQQASTLAAKFLVIYKAEVSE